MKKVVIILCIVMAAVIAAAAAVPFLVDLNRHRERILGFIQPYVPRAIDFERIDLTILTGLGLSLEQVRIADRPGFDSHDFFTLEKVLVKVELLPLLNKQVRIKKLILEKPHITLHRDSRGIFNYADLLETSQQQDALPPSGGQTHDAAGTESPLEGLAALRVAELSVRDATISVIDSSLSGPSPLAAVRGFDLTIKDLSLETPVTITSSVTMAGSTDDTLRIKGAIGPVGKELDPYGLKMHSLNISCSNLDTQKLKEYLPADYLSGITGGTVHADIMLNGSLKHGLVCTVKAEIDKGRLHTSAGDSAQISGTLNMEVSVSADTAEAALKGNIDLTNMAVHMNSRFHKAEGMPFRMLCNLKKTGNTVTVEQMNVTLNSAELLTAGSIGLNAPVKFDMSVKTNGIALEDLPPCLPLLEPFKPTGTLTADGTVTGNAERFTADVKINAPKLSAVMPAPAEEKTGPSAAALDRLDLHTTIRNSNGTFSGKGTIELSGASVAPYAAKNISSRFAYEDDSLTVSSCSLDTFNGSVQLTATVDPVRKKWSVSPELHDIDLESVLADIPALDKKFSGLFSGSFSTRCTDSAAMPQSISAEGTFNIVNGEIKNKNIASEVLSSVFNLKLISELVKLREDRLERYKHTRFDSLAGEFTSSGTRLHLKKLAIKNIKTEKATDAEVVLDGFVTLDDKNLNLNGSLILSPEHSKKITGSLRALEGLIREDRRMLIPFKATGAFDSPRFIIDGTYVRNAMKNYYSRRGIQKLLETLGGDR